MQNKTDFLIPVFIDHPDRKRNCDILIKYLNRCGIKDNNIYLLESYKTQPILKNEYKCVYKEYKLTQDYFNKMESFNALANMSKSDIIALYDIDAIVLNKDLKVAENLIINNEADVVYPYDGKFYDIPKDTVDKLYSNLDTPINVNECKLFNPNSKGGVVIFNKKIFYEGGMCNEYFKNVGYDDDEIYNRFNILAYRVKRTASPLFHMNHFRGNTSYNYNDYTENNQRMCAISSNKNKEQLKEYIKTWEWCNK